MLNIINIEAKVVYQASEQLDVQSSNIAAVVVGHTLFAFGGDPRPGLDSWRSSTLLSHSTVSSLCRFWTEK